MSNLITENSHWTQSAVECYIRNCNCSGCETQTLMNEKCQMKKVVKELVRVLGNPSSYIKRMNKNQRVIKEIIDKLQQGKTRKQIAIELDLRLSQIQAIMQKNNITLRTIKKEENNGNR